MKEKRTSRHNTSGQLPLGKSSMYKRFMKSWELQLIILLPLIYLILFKYFPMYGVQIAFRNFSPRKGILKSPWVGFTHIIAFVKSYYFTRVISNTVGISLYQLIVGFPFPIILAIMLNEARNRRFKKTVQMVTYMPYFISTVVMVSIIFQVLNPRFGILASMLQVFGIKLNNLLGVPGAFKTIYVVSGVWQQTGYSCIIYLAALSAIDVSLHEAAIVDGATRVQRIKFIDIPGILPTAIILFILRIGRMMNVGFEKVFLMQNPLNLRTSEVIATYVYKVGLVGANYSFSAGVGLFRSIINLLLLVLANKIARKIGETSLW
jgi:putative aldouronate transport system permease protein